MNELKTIKEYFPKSYNKFIKYYQYTSNIESKSLAIRDKELDIFVKTYIKNLNLRVNYDRDPLGSAYTIPHSIDLNFEKNSYLSKYPILNNLYDINNVYLKLLKAKLDATTNSNGDIIFTHNLPPDFILNVYQTSRYYKLFKNDLRARVSIILHELGHWYDVNPYIVESLLLLFKSTVYIIGLTSVANSLISNDESTSILSILSILLCIHIAIYFSINYIRSINEANCDNFAKKLGYGPDFARGMYLIAYRSTDFEKVDINKLTRLIHSLSFKIYDFIYRIFNGYPSPQDRIHSTITENILSLSFEIELKNFIKMIDDFFGN